MVKQKKSVFLVLLSVITLVLFAFGIYTVLPKPSTVVAAGESIIVTDDFKAEAINALDAYEVSRFVGGKMGDTDNTLGIVPGSSWAAYTDAGDAYITYKITPDIGYSLFNVQFSSTFKIGHQNGRYWYQTSPATGKTPWSANKLGVNAYVYTSTDNKNWSLVYDFNAANGGTETSPYIKDYGFNEFSPSIDLSSSVKNGRDLYVKFFVEHIDSSESPVDNEKTQGIALGNLGLQLYSINITADQSARVYDKVISDDFTETGTVIEKSNVYDYSHVTNHDAYGNINYTQALVPATVLQANLDADDGYIVYKMTADYGKTIDSLIINFEADYGHQGGLYWWQNSRGWSANQLGANLYVDYSYDGVNYTRVYDLNADNGNIITTEGFTTLTPKVDLTDYAEGKTLIYVRLFMEHFTVEELNYSAYTTGIMYNRLGITLSNVTLSVDFAETENPAYSFEEDFTVIGLKEDDGKTCAIETNNVASDRYGQVTYGFVPASSWGATVTAGNAYMIYKLPINGNGTFVNVSSLYFKVKYYLANRNNADLTVTASFDNSDYSVYSYSVKENKVSYSSAIQTLDLDLTDLLSNSAAVNSENLYVKISMLHDSGSFALNELGVYLHGVSVYAEQNFTMMVGASARIKTDSNGLRFTSLIKKSVYDNLVETYGSDNVSVSVLIAPYDYIATHGAFTTENLFGGSVYNVVMPGGASVDGLVNVAAVTSAITTVGAPQGYYAFSGSITDIKDANIDREFVALGIVTCVGESTVNIISDYANGNVKDTARSAAYVGQKAVEDESVSPEDKAVLKAEYLDKANGNATTYTVIHTLFAKSGNVVDISIVNTDSTVGAEVTVTPSTGFSGYTYAATVVNNGITYTSVTEGTVYANGRTVFYVYYLQD